METVIGGTDINSILTECGLGGCPKSANPSSEIYRTAEAGENNTGTGAGDTIKKNAVPILLGVIALELAYIAWRLK